MASRGSSLFSRSARVRAVSDSSPKLQEGHLDVAGQLDLLVQAQDLPVRGQDHEPVPAERLHRPGELLLRIDAPAPVHPVPVQRPLRAGWLHQAAELVPPGRVELGHLVVDAPPDQLPQRHPLLGELQAPPPGLSLSSRFVNERHHRHGAQPRAGH